METLNFSFISVTISLGLLKTATKYTMCMIASPDNLYFTLEEGGGGLSILLFSSTFSFLISNFSPIFFGNNFRNQLVGRFGEFWFRGFNDVFGS